MSSKLLVNPDRGPDYYRGIAQVGHERHQRSALALAADEIEALGAALRAQQLASPRQTQGDSDGLSYFAIIQRPNLVPRLLGTFAKRDPFEKSLREAMALYPEASINVVTLNSAGALAVEMAKEFLFDPDNPTEFMSAEAKSAWEAEFFGSTRRRRHARA